MTNDSKIVVGGRYQDDLAAFRSAWQRAENGEAVKEERVLSFESRAALSSADSAGLSAPNWDEFFDEPGVDLGERHQPEATPRDGP